ncbi:tyrosine-protein kinase family protein [Aestuariibacter salexigens]|uniref:tyrosine-protein kinase family protein n=1 Tax=Aestuariibacter salexigens TaxID=226010 RepID=UPI0003FC60C9|nr:AAA family ATPase [Aestuariibacter salexigens]
MKLIPDFYQELDSIVQTTSSCEAKCICFMSPEGGTGVSSLTMSMAQRLKKTSARVLVLDLNQYHPLSEQLSLSFPDDTKWRFDTISSQLSIIEQSGIYFLSVTELSGHDSARDALIVADAFARWRQEFDFILVDLSPLLRVNQHNIPSRVFAQAAQMTVLVVSAGETTEDALVSANQKLQEEGFNNINVVMSQLKLPPLGPQLLRKITKTHWLPVFIKKKLEKWVLAQSWLFKPIGA